MHCNALPLYCFTVCFGNEQAGNTLCNIISMSSRRLSWNSFGVTDETEKRELIIAWKNNASSTRQMKMNDQGNSLWVRVFKWGRVTLLDIASFRGVQCIILRLIKWSLLFLASPLSLIKPCQLPLQLLTSRGSCRTSNKWTCYIQSKVFWWV